MNKFFDYLTLAFFAALVVVNVAIGQGFFALVWLAVLCFIGVRFKQRHWA